MQKSSSFSGTSLAKKLAFTALFAALCCVGTLVVVIPLPASGYFNTGDVFVLLAGWFLGPIYGSIAAALGSALADVFSGFLVYAPATFFIKGLTAFLAYLLYACLKKHAQKTVRQVFFRSVCALCAETVMVLGYFLFESVLYGFVGAIPNILGNTLQGVCCSVLAVTLVSLLYPIKTVRDLFPSL